LTTERCFYALNLGFVQLKHLHISAHCQVYISRSSYNAIALLEVPMPRSSRSIGPISIAVAVGGGLLLVPEMAAAQSSDGVTGGITLSYSIGVRPAFGVGLDLRYSHYTAISQGPLDLDQ
jgi:hypothetical protein